MDGGAFGGTQAWMAMETVAHMMVMDSYSTAHQKSWVAVCQQEGGHRFG